MYAYCQDLPGVSEEMARQVEDEIGHATVDGCVAHVAGPYDGGWRIIDVWEDEATLRRFQAERLMPAVTKVTGSAEQPPGSEVRDVTSVFARV